MAGWISSKLKVAEELLQQIDQQAAESLGKSDKPAATLFQEEIRVKTGPVPLSEQIRKATPENYASSFVLDGRCKGKKQEVPSISSPSHSSIAADSDWTELLGAPKSFSSAKSTNEIASSRSPKRAQKDGSPAINYWSYRTPDEAPRHFKGRDEESENRLNIEYHHMDGNMMNDKISSFSGSVKQHTEVNAILTGNEGNLSVEKNESPVDCSRDGAHPCPENYQENYAGEALEVISGDDDAILHVADEILPSNEKVHGSLVTGSNVRETKNREGWSSSSNSDSESNSSSTGSEDGRLNEEDKRNRRDQVLAEEMMGKAAEALRERENIVARLEGEKKSLEKMLDEREKQQAEEANILQMNMIKAMEAVELEKQKHNSTRMEVFARLAKLETSNAELARSLAAAQRTLEVEITRVAELRQQVELKEDSLEELRRRMPRFNQTTLPSPVGNPNVRDSEGYGYERAIHEAEYSFLCDKIAQLQEKAKRLKEGIEITRKELEDPTEVEIELKQRLTKLTDYLIEKQVQVEALVAEKATLLFRLETVMKDVAELKSPRLPGLMDFSGGGDLEAGALDARTFLVGKIIFKKWLGSFLLQLDSIFSAGSLLISRSSRVQAWALVYLACLHLWVLYILIAHSKTTNENASGALLSLQTINKTSS